ncbi:MAG: hypothetical protein ABW173_06975 [Sphingomonas sp.]
MDDDAALQHQVRMGLAERYHAVIDRIVALAPGPDRFVHVQAGLILWLVAALASRRPLTSPAPLLAVILLEAANETMDRLYVGHWNWPDTAGEVAATLAWPVILMLALRLDPRLRGSSHGHDQRSVSAPEKRCESGPSQ